MSNSLVFKNHHLHPCSKKLIKSSFFLRLMDLCSKLGAFAHASFIFKELKNKNRYLLFIKKSSLSRFPKIVLFFKKLFLTTGIHPWLIYLPKKKKNLHYFSEKSSSSIKKKKSS